MLEVTDKGSEGSEFNKEGPCNCQFEFAELLGVTVHE
jgi:hypothetical protein